MMEWQGKDIIKYFWCDFATEVDYKHLRSKLDSHISKNSIAMNKIELYPETITIQKIVSSIIIKHLNCKTLFSAFFLRINGCRTRQGS